MKSGAYLATVVDLRVEQALKQYRRARGKNSGVGIYDTKGFSRALYARAEWNALLRLQEAQR